MKKYNRNRLRKHMAILNEHFQYNFIRGEFRFWFSSCSYESLYIISQWKVKQKYRKMKDNFIYKNIQV